jgi:hypothetical protein
MPMARDHGIEKWLRRQKNSAASVLVLTWERVTRRPIFFDVLRVHGVRQRAPGGADLQPEDARAFYFFLPEPRVGCHAVSFRFGAAAITLIFSFLGFFVSRLPLCWPFAMSNSLGFEDCAKRIWDWKTRSRKDRQMGEARRDRI